MAKFEPGQRAVAVVNGEEVPGEIVGLVDGQYAVRLDDGQVLVLRPESVLRVKGPFFGIRGLVYTTSPTHPDEQGEIIALGRGPNNKNFCRLRFGDGASEWLSEDNVLISTS